MKKSVTPTSICEALVSVMTALSPKWEIISAFMAQWILAPISYTFLSMFRVSDFKMALNVSISPGLSAETKLIRN